MRDNVPHVEGSCLKFRREPRDQEIYSQSDKIGRVESSKSSFPKGSKINGRVIFSCPASSPSQVNTESGNYEEQKHACIAKRGNNPQGRVQTAPKSSRLHVGSGPDLVIQDDS